MSSVDHQHRIGIEDLHSPGSGHRRRGLAHARLVEVALEEGLHRRYRNRKVGDLVTTQNVQLDAAVVAVRRAEVEGPAARHAARLDHLEVEATSIPTAGALTGDTLGHSTGLRRQIAGHQGRSGVEDRQLLCGDAGERVAQIVGVLQPDGRHYGDIRLSCIGRVQPSPEAGLDNGHVYGPPGKPGVGQRGSQLEVGGGMSAALLEQVGNGRDLRHRRGKLLRRHRCQPILVPLLYPLQVR